MNHKNFDTILESRINSTRKVLCNKSQEYAHGDDKLHNFHTAARIDNISTQRALWGMLMKHFVSVQDIVFNRMPNTHDLANEKIGDLINYLILLEAVLTETRQASD